MPHLSCYVIPGGLYVIPVMEYLRCGDYSGPHDTGTAAAALSP